MKIFIFALLLIFQLQSPAQRFCGTTEYLNELKNENSNITQSQELLEIRIQQFIQENSSSTQRMVLLIPVVVHVVYNTDAENISDAQVQSQIDVLNEDYRKLNADANLTPNIYQSLAADCEIEFCLATRTIDNLPTNGITRTQSTAGNFGMGNAVKQAATGGKDAWNSTRYLNIWVCDLSEPVLGFATLPGTASAPFDGVVIDYRAFGRIGNLSNSYNKGRTCTHEVGHWFNLIHTWGDDENSADNCAGTDNVGDTPNQAGPRFGCPTFPQATCGNSGDMSMNFMDYTNDACMYVFTTGQKSRMIAAINSSRSTLLSSNGCEALPAPLVCDTLNNVIGGDGLTFYLSSEFDTTSSGYLTGTNSFSDISFADKFSTTSGKQINGLLFDFATASTNAAGIVLARVWNATGPNGSPGEVIAQKSVSLQAIATEISNFQLTQVVFDAPPYVNGVFYAGFTQLNAVGDSISIFTNQEDEVNSNTAWLQNSASEWFSFEDTAAYEIKISLAVKTIVCNPVGISEVLEPVSSVAFPNPTTGILNFKLKKESSNSTWVAYSIDGRICEKGIFDRASLSLDVSNWNAGIYLFQLQQNGKYTSHKIQLIK